MDYSEDVSDFDLNFQVSVDRYGRTEFIDLIPNGGQIPVTNTNKRKYVDLYAEYLLETAVKSQFTPFSEGFLKVAGGPIFKVFFFFFRMDFHFFSSSFE